MYGILIQSAFEFLIFRYGAELAYEILDAAENIENSTNANQLLDGNDRSLYSKGRKFFIPHQLYSDKLVTKLAAIASKKVNIPFDTLIDHFGQHFVRYTMHGGYENILRLLGRTLREFIMGLDNLHEYFRVTYPKMKAPSFVVLQEDSDGMLICYRSQRGGFHAYVAGQLREVAKTYFKIQVSTIILSINTESNGCVATIMKLEFDNTTQLSYFHISEKNSVEDVSGRLVKAEVFIGLLPFFIAINKDFEILSIGRGVKAVLPSIVGDDFDDTFEIIRPTIPCDWYNIMENQNNVFEIQSLKAIEGHNNESENNHLKIIMSNNSDESELEDKLMLLHLRGQMVYFKEWDCVIFIGMPLLESVRDLKKTDIKVSELSKTDCSRDILTMGHQKESYFFGSISTKELKLGSQIDYLTKEIANYNAKRLTIYEQTIPTPILTNGTLYQSQLNNVHGAAIIYCSIMIDDLLTKVPETQPKDVVSLLNTFFSRVDTVVSNNSDFCAAVFSMFSNAHVIIAGPPSLCHLSALCGVYVACEIADLLNDCIVATHHFIPEPDAGSDITTPSMRTTTLRLDVKIGIDVGQVGTSVIKSLIPPRFALVGPVLPRAEAAANTANVRGIAWTRKVSELLDNSEMKDNYTFETREILPPFKIGDKSKETVMHIDKLESINRELLSRIVKPPPVRSRASSFSASSQNDSSSTSVSASNNNGNNKTDHQKPTPQQHLANTPTSSAALNNLTNKNMPASNNNGNMLPPVQQKAEMLAEQNAGVISVTGDHLNNENNNAVDKFLPVQNRRCLVLGPAKNMCTIS